MKYLELPTSHYWNNNLRIPHDNIKNSQPSSKRIDGDGGAESAMEREIKRERELVAAILVVYCVTVNSRLY